MNEVADGVWRITGGFPLRINAYLVRDGEGVAVFDAGIRSMGSKLRGAAQERGGTTRVVIGNAHADHRGGAKAIGAPVHCHAYERADVEGDGGAHYFDYGKLSLPTRLLTPRMFGSWDDGPVDVAATLAEGIRSESSRSFISRATAPAASASGASATASPSQTTASHCSTPTSPGPGAHASLTPPSTGQPTLPASRSKSWPR